MLIPDLNNFGEYKLYYNEKDSKKTFDAMRAGAVDFVLKPSGEISLDIRLNQI